MQIIIVGAGLAGLSTALALSHSGYKVLLLESASKLAEVGAGVQLTPVATRQFLSWGLGPSLLAAAALPESWSLRRGENGEVLSRVPMKELEEVYGAPYIVVHRADLHAILHEHAVKRGAELKLNSRVKEYGFEEGWVKLESGERLEADLVVACDGIKSLARTQFLKEKGDDTEVLEPTGWAAYRAMVDVSAVRKDPMIADVVAQHAGNCWAGDGRSLMTYMIQDSGRLNLVFSHLDDVTTDNWTKEHFITELKNSFGGFDVRVQKLVDLINTPVTNWPVYQVKFMRTWVSNSGKFVLLGDASHAMAFYLSMGVSMAVEDAAALVSCLDLHASSLNAVSLSKAMELLESVRKPRAEAVRNASLHAAAMLHIGPGKEKEMRDEAAKTDGASCYTEGSGEFGFLTERISYGITDKRIRDWCYGYDVVGDINRRLKTF